MKRILFSCVGNTDPVRGEHDGPMLHIARHYRPEVIYLFFTLEISERWQREQRLSKTGSQICSHWDGYVPKWREMCYYVINAHDLDVLDEPIHHAVAVALRENPDAELLVNLTSGTPQMQMLLSQIAMDLRYPVRGIQVRNFEHSSGTTERANDKTYDIDLELECNEDDLPGSTNRCSEPKLYSIRREYTRRQLNALLDQRNFDAVSQLADSMPKELGTLAKHMACRNRLEHPEALRLAGELKGLPFPLYAYKTGSRSDYTPLCEYYLLMRNLVSAGQYSRFLLHMEPLTLKLQLALLGLLLKSSGSSVTDFITTDRRSGKQSFDPDKLAKVYPDLYEHYLEHLAEHGWDARKAEISTYLCSDLLGFFPEIPAKPQALFKHYLQLKELRNRLAHEFYSCTAQDIHTVCGVSPEQLLCELEGTIVVCYEACDPSIFSVYDKCIAYLKEKL